MSVISLTYRGDGAYRPGLPARDLDQSDLEALVATTKRSLDDIVDEAVSSGLYLAVTLSEKRARAARSAPEPEPVVTHADPLEDPATTRPMLLEMAQDLGLTVASRDTKVQIVDAIRAERARLTAPEPVVTHAEETVTPPDGATVTTTDTEGTPV